MTEELFSASFSLFCALFFLVVCLFCFVLFFLISALTCARKRFRESYTGKLSWASENCLFMAPSLILSLRKIGESRNIKLKGER